MEELEVKPVDDLSKSWYERTVEEAIPEEVQKMNKQDYIKVAATGATAYAISKTVTSYLE